MKSTVKIHSDRYSRYEDGVCNPDGGWGKSTRIYSRVTCGHCIRALRKEGLLSPASPTQMVSIPFNQLEKLKKDLAEAKAWKRKAIESLRRL